MVLQLEVVVAMGQMGEMVAGRVADGCRGGGKGGLIEVFRVGFIENVS